MRSGSWAEQITAYYRTGILLDANLMVLYIVGSYDIHLIGKHKRTDTFIKDDFTFINRLLKNFATRITTPHILTEVSNLTEGLLQHSDKGFATHFRNIIPHHHEQYETSVNLSGIPAFPKFGLADSSVMQVAQDGNLVLSVDSRLCSYLSNIGLPAFNYNHIRYDLILKSS
jgi:hypothetical protein